MAFKSTGVRVESVTFNGYKYNRYPDAKRQVHRTYFSRSGQFLHRAIWEFHNGPIPKGHQIHHIDGDSGNNAIENLMCVSVKEHRKEHEGIYGSEAQLKHLASIRDKASQWHKSEKGMAWHKKHASDNARKAHESIRLNGYKQKAYTCCWCGFEGLANNTRKKFCSTRCQSAESGFRLGKTSTQHPYHASRVQP